MIFTRHACERYRQFHLLDRPTATDADAAALLVEHGPSAVKLPARTIRGDEVWTIHALGVELVVKRDGDFEEPVCVTVLPPARFRGLTPLLAEQVEESQRRALEMAEAAKLRLAEANRDTEKRRVAAKQAEAAKRKKDKPGTTAAQQAGAHAEAKRIKQAAVQAQRDFEERLQQARNEAEFARVESAILTEALRTMRMQLEREHKTERMRIARDHDSVRHKAALRIAVRHLRATGASEVLGAIAAIDPGLASEAFANGDGP